MKLNDLLTGDWALLAPHVDEELWSQVAEFAVGRLEHSLALSLKYEPPVIDKEAGFCLECRTIPKGGGVVGLQFRSIVGTDFVDDRLLVRASLFMYSMNDLLQASGEYLELILEPQNEGTWKRIGWRTGEPGEFDDFATFFPVPQSRT